MTTITIVRGHVASGRTLSSSAVHRPGLLACSRCLRQARAAPGPRSGGTRWCPSPFAQGRRAAEKPHGWKGAGQDSKPSSSSSRIRCPGGPLRPLGPPALPAPHPSPVLLSVAEKHQQVAAVAPERPGFQLSEPRKHPGFLSVPGTWGPFPQNHRGLEVLMSVRGPRSGH